MNGKCDSSFIAYLLDEAQGNNPGRGPTDSGGDKKSHRLNNPSQVISISLSRNHRRLPARNKIQPEHPFPILLLRRNWKRVIGFQHKIVK
jgi:hypothetical protein